MEIGFTSTEYTREGGVGDKVRPRLPRMPRRKISPSESFLWGCWGRRNEKSQALLIPCQGFLKDEEQQKEGERKKRMKYFKRTAVAREQEQ